MLHSLSYPCRDRASGTCGDGRRRVRTAEAICSGVITAAGGQADAEGHASCSPRPLPELDTFVYAASEWDDRPEDQQTFEKGILAAASDLVRGPIPA